MDNKTIMENDIPPHIWEFIHEFLIGVDDQHLDLREAHLRPSIVRFVPFIIFMYSLLIIIGVISNLAVFYHIIKHRLYSDPTYSFFLNNVVSDMMKCIIVLPITLFVLLVQNWMLGELMCSFLPMLQDIPLHTTTLTFLLMAWDRYRYVRHPTKPRLPAFVCTIGSWLTAMCLVLPYPIYIIYVDLGLYTKFELFKGVGLCIVNLADDMKEYMRGIFLIMYAGPMATISYLFVRTSRELALQNPPAIIMYESRGRESRPRTDSHSTTTEIRSSRGDCDLMSQYSRGSYRDHDYGRARYEPYEPDLNVIKEKRTQKYLVTMVTVYAMCLCPLMILRLARLALLETYDNSASFDFIYTMFVWVAFIPICSTPLLYTFWQMSRSSKERLRGYFRFSSRKLRQSCETVTTTEGTPAVPRSKCYYRNDSFAHQIDEGFSENNSYQADISSS